MLMTLENANTYLPLLRIIWFLAYFCLRKNQASFFESQILKEACYYCKGLT